MFNLLIFSIMKKIVLSLVMAFGLLAFSGCEGSDIPTLQKLQGQWMCVGEGGSIYPSDSVSGFVFNTDMTCSISKGESTMNGGTRWDVDVNYNYSLRGDIITITSNGSATEEEIFIFEIGDISGGDMECTLINHTLNGIANTYSIRYSMVAANSTYLNSVLVDLWGSEVSNSTDLEEYWAFSDGGYFAYYLYNTSSGQYEITVSEDSGYTFYGDFVIMNFPTYGSTVEHFEVWTVESATTEQVIWYRKQNDGTVIYDTLVPKPALP